MTLVNRSDLGENTVRKTLKEALRSRQWCPQQRANRCPEAIALRPGGTSNG